MVKFYFDLNSYDEQEVSNDIKKIKVIDRKKLQDTIDTFQKELDWRQMWSVDDAQPSAKALIMSPLRESISISQVTSTGKVTTRA